MKFKLTLDAKPSKYPIEYGDKLMLIGSCFTENIGAKFKSHLFELSEFGKKYSQYILEEISSKTPSIHKIKDYSKKIDEIDHLQGLVLKTSPNLAPIVDYFAIRKGNLFGDNVVTLTESSYYAFLECSNLCSALFELIENTISEHKNFTGKASHRSDASNR